MVEYVKVRRGAGLEFEGIRLSSRYTRDLLDRVAAGEPYVIYREVGRLKGRALAAGEPYVGYRGRARGKRKVGAESFGLTGGRRGCTVSYMPIEKVPTLTPTRLIILKALEDHPRHGFDMIQATRGKLPSGRLYPELRTLTLAGYLAKTEESEADARRRGGSSPRTYYQLTQNGRQALEAGVSYYLGSSKGRVPTLLDLVRKLKEI